MAVKTVPLSVRVTDEDAAFLAGLDIPGANTPSEKLRAILSHERERQQGTQDPLQALEFIRDLLRPAYRQIRRQETAQGRSSDFVRRLYDRLPEIMALAFAGPGRSDQADLAEFEGRLLDQVFALLAEMLELGLVERSRCYDPGAIAARLGPIMELGELVRVSRERRKGDA